MDAAPGPDAAASDDDDGHEAFEKYRNPRDSTATLPSPKESSGSIHNTRTDKEEVDGREVASNGVAASSPADLDIDGWRIDSDENSDAGKTELVEEEIVPPQEDAEVVAPESTAELSGNATEQGEAKEDVVAGFRKRKSECLQIEVPELSDESSRSLVEGLCSDSRQNIAEPSLKRNRPLSTEEREMMKIAQHHAARVRERSRTERYRRKTLVAKAADTPITAGILPCSTTKLTMPQEPKLHTTARAAGSGQTPRMETPTDGADQVDGLAVAAERFSSRLREASNPRWTGKPTVPISPRLAHMRSRSRPAGTAIAGGSLHNTSQSTENSIGSASRQDHENSDEGSRVIESLAAEAERFGSRLRESSRTRWTGRPTVPSSPRFSRAKAWRYPGLNQSAVELERSVRHPVGPGTPSNSEKRPKTTNTLREEAQGFTKKLRENIPSLRWTGRITIPRSPNLSHNRGGSRINNTFCMADSLGNSGLDTSFKARPAPPSTRRPHAVPLGPLRSSTKPKSPNLRTRARSKITPNYIGEGSKNGDHKFIARPVPRRILEEVQFTVDLGPEKVTVPHGPEFNTEKRSLERSMQRSFMSSDESVVTSTRWASGKYIDTSSILIGDDASEATAPSEAPL